MRLRFRIPAIDTFSIYNDTEYSITKMNEKKDAMNMKKQ